MELRVLGCNGGLAPGARTTAFLIDGWLLVDAGTVGSVLPEPEMNRITHVVLTHVHADHIRELPYIPISRVRGVDPSLHIVSVPMNIDRVQRHVFTTEMWLDFQGEAMTFPKLEYVPVSPLALFHGPGDETIEFVPVRHVDGCMGVIVSNGTTGFAFSSDTGPTEALWERLADYPEVETVVLECSYPAAHEDRALREGHLATSLLEAEIAKMPSSVTSVLVTHIKPRNRQQVLAEIKALGIGKVSVLKNGHRIMRGD